MNKYLIDSNIIIQYFRKKFDLISKIEEIGIRNCFISEITIAELKYGFELSLLRGFKINPKFLELLDRLQIVPISGCIDFYAKEKARLQNNGTPIHDNFDLLIACSSVTNGMIMVTENYKDFKNIKDIRIENWINRNQ